MSWLQSGTAYNFIGQGDINFVSLLCDSHLHAVGARGADMQSLSFILLGHVQIEFSQGPSISEAPLPGDLVCLAFFGPTILTSDLSQVLRYSRSPGLIH